MRNWANQPEIRSKLSENAKKQWENQIIKTS
jgi:hypothetical protein